MHFRQLIITGFIASAAMLAPDIALAEKGSHAGKPDETMAAEQVILPDKAENAKTSEPAAKNQITQKEPVIEKPVMAKPKDIPKAVPKQMSKTKPTVAVKAQGEAPSFMKNEKAAIPQNAKAVGTKIPNQAKSGIKHSSNHDNKVAVRSIHSKGDYTKETKRKSPGLKGKVESPQDIAATQDIKKRTDKAANRKNPPVKDDRKDPSQNERYPKGDNLPNPPSRTKASGGPSSDRTSYGNTSTSYSDKWFVWSDTFNLNFILPYTSRVAVFRNQWVNAPPSPPPLKAPAFLTYTEAICHG